MKGLSNPSHTMARYIVGRASCRSWIPPNRYTALYRLCRNQSTSSPSTIDSGFILNPARLPNPATSDPAYRRILQWYLPASVLDKLWPRLEKFGNEAVSDEINRWIADAEKNQPYVKSRNVWGLQYPYDRLVTSEGWKRYVVFKR
jgi:hypothetical protein